MNDLGELGYPEENGQRILKYPEENGQRILKYPEENGQRILKYNYQKTQCGNTDFVV